MFLLVTTSSVSPAWSSQKAGPLESCKKTNFWKMPECSIRVYGNEINWLFEQDTDIVSIPKEKLWLCSMHSWRRLVTYSCQMDATGLLIYLCLTELICRCWNLSRTLDNPVKFGSKPRDAKHTYFCITISDFHFGFQGDTSLLWQGNPDSYPYPQSNFLHHLSIVCSFY